IGMALCFITVLRRCVCGGFVVANVGRRLPASSLRHRGPLQSRSSRAPPKYRPSLGRHLPKPLRKNVSLPKQMFNLPQRGGSLRLELVTMAECRHANVLPTELKRWPHKPHVTDV